VTTLPAAPTFRECLEILHRELVQARNVVGYEWGAPATTPSLSGPQRYELAVLLQTLSWLRVHLSALASGEPDVVLANIVDWALGDAAPSNSNACAPAAPTPATSQTLPPSVDHEFEDDGPFGPIHDT
jgi:hypothetical protein